MVLVCRQIKNDFCGKSSFGISRPNFLGMLPVVKNFCEMLLVILFHLRGLIVVFAVPSVYESCGCFEKASGAISASYCFACSVHLNSEHC